ncbi:MAG TPA: hypothetical protein VGJ84_15990 [Polyangiaceae bacterium]
MRSRRTNAGLWYIGACCGLSLTPLTHACKSRSRQPAVDSCGALGCALFDSPEVALERVLQSSPGVLAVGETHVQKGTETVESATQRFTESLLPRLASRASDLVIELWVAEGACGRTEQRVAEQQKPVTRTQAPSAQSEFVKLAERAKLLGIQPHVLRPPCVDYQRIADAGAEAVDRMLELVARLTAEKVEALVKRNRALHSDRLVITYGGAIHNDLRPGAGHEAWSFGPRLEKFSGGRYVELDLIVPEYMKETDAWRSLPWYAEFRPGQFPGRVTLFNPSLRSYALIFARSAVAAK